MYYKYYPVGAKLPAIRKANMVTILYKCGRYILSPSEDGHVCKFAEAVITQLARFATEEAAVATMNRIAEAVARGDRLFDLTKVEDDRI